MKLMNKRLRTFQIIFFAVLGMLSLKMMYQDPIAEPVEYLSDQKIVYAECPSDKYARPFFKIVGNDLRYHVINEFTYRTGCGGKNESSIYGQTVSFKYFKDSAVSGKVIEIKLNSEQVYAENEFVGKTTSSGAVLFFALVGFAVWSFSGPRRHNKAL